VNKTITIGIPSFKGPEPEVLQDYMMWMYNLGRHAAGQYNFQLAIKGRSEQFRARNAIVKAALQHNADYLLMLDDDHIIGINDTNWDFLQRLIKHLENDPKKGIVGGLYYQRGGDTYPVCMQEHEGGYFFIHHSEITGKLQKMSVVGGGCMLLRMSMFDKLEEPWFGPEYEYGTDIQICRQAEKAGFEVWIDTSVEIGHLMKERQVISSHSVEGGWRHA
jgi:GT2 family glycosyltransferase